jgi:hypothetical protein
MVHAIEDVFSENVPLGQVLQFVSPVSNANLPGTQGRQDAWPFVF